MADWSKLQQQMGVFIKSHDDASAILLEDVEPGVIGAENRLNIYRNNFFESVSGSLVDVFPVSCAFVGDVFLRQCLKAFIMASPPLQPVLYHYGRAFPAFLRAFDPAQSVPYLADLAEMEWLTHELMLVDDAVAELDEQTGRKAAADNDLVLADTARFLDSEFPVFDLWLAATGQLPPEKVDIESGGQAILIVLREGQVSYEPVVGAVAALSGLLSRGQSVPPTLFGHIRHLADRGALATNKKEQKNA